MYSKEKLKKDLENMGLKKGDVILIRASLKSIGQVDFLDKMDYINVILDIIGDEGTLISLAFTNSNFILRKKNIIFDGSNDSYAGGFPNLMLKHPKSLRSKHPMNSYVAIGKYADYILKDHDENSGAYEPIRKIIELNGKMMLIGCVKSSPGFTTTHLAEVDLGLHKRIIFPTLTTVYYKKDNKIKLFKRKDLGSCSKSFYKFYSYYVFEEKLITGKIGDAYSIMINAKDAYDIDYKVLKKNPRITICGDINCFTCNARRWDNIYKLPIYILNFLIKKLKKTKKLS